MIRIVLLLLISIIFVCNVSTLNGSEKCVVIDPGHPSEVNSGRALQNGTTELEMNWNISERLGIILKNTYKINVMKTRVFRDLLVTNRKRSEIANSMHAALFLRLHCDTGSGTGFTVYYPDRQGTKEGKTGPSQEIIEQSRLAAKAVHLGLFETLGEVLKDNGIKGDSQTFVGRKQGALTGSIYSEVPAVTVEMVFLSNKSDAEFIKSEAGQVKLAQGLAKGVLFWLKEKNQ